MSSKNAFEVRNLQFELGGVDRYWHGQRKSVTTFFNNLSIFFPAGERFFIQSVKAHKDVIRDPQLAVDARTFYAQEAYHTREHVRYNTMLREQGYPIEAMDARVEKLLSWVRRLIPPLWQLAVTCALEHFTALIADWLLATPRVMHGAHPSMAALWRWHAAEENEHKAVAFDVYKAAGGSYFMRCLIMLFTTLIFWGKVFEHQVRLMHKDGTLCSLEEWVALAKYLFASPGGLQQLIPSYLDYYRPRFHPWQHDNRHLLEAWKEELARSPAYTVSSRLSTAK